MPSKSKTDPGNVFEVPLDDGGWAYGIVVRFPLAAFFDFRATERPMIGGIVSRPVVFRIWIMSAALGRNGWRVIGTVPLTDELAKPVRFYKFDRIAKKFSLYSTDSEITATREQCIGHECAAVWSANHVESRLSDHFAGRPNKWVMSLSDEDPL